MVRGGNRHYLANPVGIIPGSIEFGRRHSKCGPELFRVLKAITDGKQGGLGSYRDERCGRWLVILRYKCRPHGDIEGRELNGSQSSVDCDDVLAPI